MGARQLQKPTRKAMPAARRTPTRRAAGKPKAATSGPKPASMTGPLPPIVTLKHLAEWAGYHHGVPKKQAVAMLTGFVTDIGRALTEAFKFRIADPGTSAARIEQSAGLIVVTEQ